MKHAGAPRLRQPFPIQHACSSHTETSTPACFKFIRLSHAGRTAHYCPRPCSPVWLWKRHMGQCQPVTTLAPTLYHCWKALTTPVENHLPTLYILLICIHTFYFLQKALNSSAQPGDLWVSPPIGTYWPFRKTLQTVRVVNPGSNLEKLPHLHPGTISASCLGGSCLGPRAKLHHLMRSLPAHLKPGKRKSRYCKRPRVRTCGVPL